MIVKGKKKKNLGNLRQQRGFPLLNKDEQKKDGPTAVLGNETSKTMGHIREELLGSMINCFQPKDSLCS